MKRQLLYNILLVWFFLPAYLLQAQDVKPADIDITGLWKGYLYNDSSKKNLAYEIAVSEEKGQLTGFSYTIFDVDGKKEIGVKKIKIKRTEDKVIIEDVELIANNYSEPPPRKVRMLSMVNLAVNDTAMELSGKWSTNQTREYSPVTGNLQLYRALNYRQQLLFKKLVELKLEKTLSFLTPEKTANADVALNETQIGGIKLPAPQPSARIAEKIKAITVVSPADKKQDVAVVTEKPKTPAPPPPVPEKKAEPITAAKEPAKKETKPPTAPPAKQQVVQQKPATNTTAVVTKPAAVPVAIAAKTETKPPAVVVSPPETKKELPPPVVVAPVVQGAALNVADRKMSKEQSVFFESDSLVLTLYDNGDVDGDTVSVLMNGEIIFAKQGLSTKANSKTIYLDKGMPDSLSMVMYAENLGSIPPNTGLLVIMDGEKRYEVRFSADLKTNSAILLRRRPKEK